MSTNAPAAKAPAKSVLNESKQIERAAMLIQMGARMTRRPIVPADPEKDARDRVNAELPDTRLPG